MRNLILLLVLLAGGYWVYEHHFKLHPLAVAPPSPPYGELTLPETVAWKAVVHVDSPPMDVVALEILDGNRWRTEMRKLPGAQVAVMICDGVNYRASNKKAPQAQNPRIAMAKDLADLSHASYLKTENVDGRECWVVENKGDLGRQESWVDMQSRFPVRTEEWPTTESHRTSRYWKLTPDLTKLGPRLFDTSQTTPMFAQYLTP